MSGRHGVAAPGPDGPAAAARTGAARGYAAAALALLLAFVLLAQPWWRDGLVVPWDAKNQFYPVLRWLAGEIAAGRLPLFMGEIYAGRPSLPDPQSMVLSPGFLALAALDPAPSMRLADMLLLGELLLAGAAILALGALRGVHPAAALLAALVVVFGGAPMARLQHVLLVQSYAFVPVVLLAVELFLRRPTIPRGLLAGAAAGLLAVGRDHVAFLSLAVVAAWALEGLLAGGRPVRWLRGAAAGIAAGALAAAAVAVPPILATVGFAAESNRPAFALHEAAVSPVPVAALLTLWIPDVFGGLFDVDAYRGPGTPGWRWPVAADTSTVQLYAGVAAVVLFALYAPALRGAGRLQPFGAGVVLFALLYGLGQATPAYAAFYHLVPGVDLFRRPADAAYLLNLGLGLFVLGAAGRYVRDGLPPGRVGVVGLGLAVAAVLAGAIAVGLLHGRLADLLPALAAAALAGALATGLLLAGGRGGRARRAAVVWVLAALTAADLAVFSAGTALNARPVGEWEALERPLDDARVRALVERVAAAEAAEGPVRVEILGLGGAFQNLSLVAGLDNVTGYNPLRPAAYERATGAPQNSHLPRRPFGEQMTGYRSPLADLLGLRYILLGAPMETVDPASAPFFGPPERIGNAFLYENRRALPRAVLVRADRTVPMERALAEGAGPLPDLDWRAEALVGLAAPGGPAPATPAGEGAAGELEIVEHAPGRLVARIAPEADGYVVLHELANPGWTATVDGERRPLVPANGLFQAVPVGPGDRLVTFAFEGPFAAIGR